MEMEMEHGFTSQSTKVGRFGDVLPNESVVSVMKKLKSTKLTNNTKPKSSKLSQNTQKYKLNLYPQKKTKITRRTLRGICRADYVT